MLFVPQLAAPNDVSFMRDEERDFHNVQLTDF